MANTHGTCQALTATGDACRNPATSASGLCSIHARGVVKPSGPSRYTRHLPSHLRRHYRDALADPHLCSLKESLALLETRIVTLLGRMGTPESETRWRQLQDAYNLLMAARQRADGGGMARAMGRLQDAISGGNADEETWRELQEVLRVKRELTQAETRRQHEAGDYITVERFLAFVTAITHLIVDRVPDLMLRQDLCKGLTSLTDRVGGRIIDEQGNEVDP